MHVNPVDSHNIMSFLWGFEMGAKTGFMNELRCFLETRYKAKYDCLGVPGQIKRLSEKKSQSWEFTFRAIALEMLTIEESAIDNKTKTYLKTAVMTPIQRVNEFADTRGTVPWLAKYWLEDWPTYTFLRHPWLGNLWNEKQWKTIRKINRLVQKGGIFLDAGNTIPCNELIALCKEFSTY